MDAIDHFVAVSLTPARVTYVHLKKGGGFVYALAHRLPQPTLRLAEHQSSRNTRNPRYYISRGCVSRPWASRKIGPLYTPDSIAPEAVEVGQDLLLDVSYGHDGIRAVAYLPFSWSKHIVIFFRYCSDLAKVRWMMESQETREILQAEMMIPFLSVRVPTLYHAIVCLAMKEFDTVIDMLRVPRLRLHPGFQTFEELQQAPDVQRTGLRIPSTTEFVVELAFWTQNVEMVHSFAQQLKTCVDKNPTNFKASAHEFLEKKDKVVIYMERVLRHMSSSRTF